MKNLIFACHNIQQRMEKKNDKVQGGDGTKKHAEESSKIYALL